jgi:hypothetical protein
MLVVASFFIVVKSSKENALLANYNGSVVL